MAVPALTVPWSATLVISRLPQLTVMLTGPTEGLPSLVEPTLALLATVPQLAEVVGLVMWTWTEAPGARLAGPKPRTPAAMFQEPVVPPASMAQLRPPLVGSVSATLTPVAVPAPVLVSVMT